jgi:hypothetical protein
MKYLSWFLGWSHRLTKPVRQLPHVARRFQRSGHRHNVLGSFVVTLAVGYLYVHAQPTTAGTDPISLNGGQDIAEVTQEFNGSEKSPSSVAANDTPTLTGKEALTECDRILGEGEAKLAKIPAYAATFVKQERIGDALTELQVIQLRMFHQPKRISMKWEGGKDAGQRVIYAEGENDGDMLVRKLTGIEARLGVIALNPSGVLAMKHSRHPVTQAGLLEMTRITRQYRQADLKLEAGISAKLLEHQKLNGRDCLCLVVEYEKPDFAPDEKKEYRKTMVFIDSQTKLPACVRCYGWPEKIADANPQKLDQTTLLELYAYKNIDFEAQVQADDFSRARLQ